MLELRNPHSVLAALRARPTAVREIRLPPRGGDGWQQVAREAQRHRITVHPAPPPAERGPRRGAAGDGREGLGFGRVDERAALPAAELFTDVTTPGLWLALDSVQDPRNVGSIFRSAAFFGVRGVLMTETRSAPLSAVVYDVASGGVEAVPFAIETNLRRSLEVARGAGLWLLGSSEHAEKTIDAVPLDRPWLLVLGNEERGLRRLTRETCDELCRIGAAGDLASLNVSVAAGVLMAALTRDANPA